jgi:hypothetical protein
MDVGALTGVLAVALAVPGAYLAARQWKGEEEALLFIPAPTYGQNPLAPDFWVFPPVSCGDVDAVVIAGKIVNAGPATARSVRVYADPAQPFTEAKPALMAAFDVVVTSNPDRGEEVLWEEWLEHYRDKKSFIPLLREGEELRFVVIACYSRPNAYIERIQKQGGVTLHYSRDWTQDGRQAHTVHLVYRTKRGKLVELGPGELCAPGEKV